MRRSPSLAPICCAGVAALLLAPAAAAGGIRYAAPGGAGSGPCNPTPCTLAKAVSGAIDGDQVVVTPGTYKPNAEVKVDKAIDVGGQPGAAVPTIELGLEGVRINNAGATVHDLRIELPGATMAHALSLEAGTVERVYTLSGENNSGACEVLSGLLRDSVCWGAFAGVTVGASGGGPNPVLVNDTTASIFVLAGAGVQVSVEARNVIAQAPLPGKADIYFDVSSGGSANVNFSHSNYSTVDTSLSGGTTFTYTQPGTNGNQTAEPLFVNAASGDLHEAAGSPTVDAGASDSPIGALDLDRNPRVEPPCLGGSPVPDIGAYELVPTAACPKPSNRFSLGKLRRNRKKGTAKLAVSLSGAGTLSLSGKGVVRQAKSGSGTLSLLIKAKGKSRRKLERTGAAKVKVTVTFTPAGGDPATQARTVKLLEKAPR
jgi:hypothetical protein